MKAGNLETVLLLEHCWIYLFTISFFWVDVYSDYQLAEKTKMHVSKTSISSINLTVRIYL